MEQFGSDLVCQCAQGCRFIREEIRLFQGIARNQLTYPRFPVGTTRC